MTDPVLKPGALIETTLNDKANQLASVNTLTMPREDAIDRAALGYDMNVDPMMFGDAFAKMKAQWAAAAPEVSFDEVVRKNPHYAEWLMNPINMSVGKDHVSYSLDIPSLMEDMQGKETLPWATKLGHSIAAGGKGTGEFVLSIPAGLQAVAEFAGNKFINATGLSASPEDPNAPSILSDPDRWYGKMMLGMHDPVTAMQKAEAEFTQSGFKEVAGVFMTMAADPSMWALPGAAFARGGKLAGTTLRGFARAAVEEQMGTSIRLVSSKTMAPVFNEFAAVQASSLMAGVQNAGFTIRQQLETQMELGKSPNVDWAVAGAATMAGLTTYGLSVFSGASSELRLFGGKTATEVSKELEEQALASIKSGNKSAALAIKTPSAMGVTASRFGKDLAKDPISEGLDEFLTNVYSDAFSDKENVDWADAAKSGVMAFFATFGFVAMPAIKSAFSDYKQVLLETEIATKGVANAQNLAKIDAQFNVLPQNKIQDIDRAVSLRNSMITAMFGGPAANVKVSIDKALLDEHAVKTGFNARELVDRTGDVSEYDAPVGSMVSMDLPKLLIYLGNNTAHKEFFFDHLLTAGGGMTLAESREHFKGLEKRLADIEERVTASSKAPTLPSGAADDSSLVHKDVMDAITNDPNWNPKMKSAGDVSNQAAMYAAVIRVLAERENARIGKPQYTPLSYHRERGAKLGKVGNAKVETKTDTPLTKEEIDILLAEAPGKTKADNPLPQADIDALLAELTGKTNTGGQTLAQGADTGPQALIDTTNNIIQMMPTMDRSSFAHEVGHLYLNALDASDPDIKVVKDWVSANAKEALANAPAEVRAAIEAKAALKSQSSAEYIKANIDNFTSDRDVYTVVHEHFARGHEKFLRDGKVKADRAGKLNMEKVFAYFTKFMSQIYKMAETLGVTISPEIRDVYDRMYTLDQDIQQQIDSEVRPLFADKELALLPPKIREIYLNATRAKRAKATQAVIDRIREEIKVRESAKYKSKLDDATLAAQTEIESRPEFMAIAAMKGGKRLGNGSPTGVINGSLNIDSIKDRVAPEILDMLETLGYATTDGKITDVDGFSQQFGYADVEAMSNDVVNADFESDMAARAQEIVIENSIENRATDEAFITAEVDKAVTGGARDDLAEVEIGIIYNMDKLLKGTEADKVSGVTPERQAEIDAEFEKQQTLVLANGGPAHFGAATRAYLKMLAIDKVLGIPVKDLDYKAYEREAARKRREVFTHLAKKDYKAAYRAEYDSMAATEMAKASKLAEESAIKDQKAINSLNHKDAQHKLAMGGPWKVAIPGQPVGIEQDEDKAKEAVDIYNDMNATGPRAMYSRSTVWREVANNLLALYGARVGVPPTESLRVTMDNNPMPGGPAVRPASVYDRTQPTKTDEISAGELSDLADALRSIMAAANRNNTLIVDGRRMSKEEAVASGKDAIADLAQKKSPDLNTQAGETKSYAARAFESLVNFSNRVRQADGGKDTGWFYNNLWVPIQRLNDKFFIRRGEEAKKEKALLDRYSTSELARKVSIPGVAKKYTKAQILQIMLHNGNDVGRQRLLTNAGLTAENVQAMIDTLNEKDEAFLHDYWALSESLKPELIALNSRMGEPDPKWKTVTPFRSSDGRINLRGGYSHIVYRQGFTAPVNPLERLNGYVSGNTGMRPSSSFLKPVAEKVDPSLQLSLDLSQQLDNRIAELKDITYREYAVNSARLLNGVEKDLDGKLGYGFTNMLRADLDTGINGAPPANNPWESAAVYLRNNLTVATLAFRTVSALSQATGLLNAMGDKRTRRYMLTSLIKFVANIGDISSEIFAASPEMKERLYGADADLKAMRNKMQGKLIGDAVATYGTAPLRGMQSLVDQITWLSAREQAKINGMDESAQIDFANRAVSDIMGSGRDTSLSPALRSNLVRVFYMFGSYMNAVFNQNVSAYRNIRSPSDVKGIAEAVTTSATTVLLPMIAYELVKSATRGDDFGPEERDSVGDWAVWTAKLTTAQMLSFAPFFKDVGGALQDIPTNVLLTRPLGAIGQGLSAGAEKLQGHDANYSLHRFLQGLQFLPIPAIVNTQAIDAATALISQDSPDYRAAIFGPKSK